MTDSLELNIGGLTGAFDAFEDAKQQKDPTGGSAPVAANKVHIRVQQRNGRKSLTTVQGLNPSYDFKKVLQEFRKKFNCNGTIVQDDELGEVIQIQGDQRRNVQQFLVETELVKKDNIIMHGF